MSDYLINCVRTKVNMLIERLKLLVFIFVNGSTMRSNYLSYCTDIVGIFTDIVRIFTDIVGPINN
jgi:hypothetical protein